MEFGEVSVVVDIAVEHCRDVGAVGTSQLLGVEGVSIRFRDDADAGPACVPEDNDFRFRAGECLMEEFIGADTGSQRASIIS